MQVATRSFGYGYSPLNLLDSNSFLVEACAKVNELFNLFQGGSIVHYVDARCVSADDHDFESSWRSMIDQSVQMLCQHHLPVAEACLLSLPRGPHHLHISGCCIIYPLSQCHLNYSHFSRACLIISSLYRLNSIGESGQP